PRTRTQTFPTRSGLHPDTPHQCVRAQCNFRFSSASSPTRSLRSVVGAAASGIISRMLSAILLLFCSKMRSVSHPEHQNAIFWCR
ncbi:hypothetical protein KX394_24580, partial [Escherichia coli]|nr:hypothetical protein [Escherichia coli]